MITIQFVAFVEHACSNAPGSVYSSVRIMRDMY